MSPVQDGRKEIRGLSHQRAKPYIKSSSNSLLTQSKKNRKPRWQVQRTLSVTLCEIGKEILVIFDC
jgi:hypothetical protein